MQTTTAIGRAAVDRALDRVARESVERDRIIEAAVAAVDAASLSDLPSRAWRMALSRDIATSRRRLVAYAAIGGRVARRLGHELEPWRPLDWRAGYLAATR